MTTFLVVLAIAAVGVIGFRLIKAGADREKAKQGVQNAKAAERIAESHATAPVNLTELRQQLRDGTRKL